MCMCVHTGLEGEGGCTSFFPLYSVFSRPLSVNSAKYNLEIPLCALTEPHAGQIKNLLCLNVPESREALLQPLE